MRFFILLLAVSASAGDWPIYRGPHHDGISRETEWALPKSGPPKLWQANIGIGYSSIAVANGFAYSMGNVDGVDTVYCFDAVSGKELWKHSYDAELGPLYYEGGPGATPTVDGDRVYTISKWGDLLCFDAKSGKIRWQRHLESEEGSILVDWGFSGAPYPYGKLLLLNVGTAGMAVDKLSGKTVWKSENGECGYSTPYPFKWKGKTHFVFSSGNSYSGVDPTTGKRSWEITWYTRYGVNAADPIVGDDQIFVSSGYSKGAGMFQLGSAEPKELWRARKYRNQFNSSVLIAGHLYGFDGDNNSRAKLKCVSWKTGEDLWEEDGIGFGSLLAADSKLIVLSPKGELIVAPASTKGFKPIARAKIIGGKCWTVPTLANGRLYARNAQGDLVCVDLRPKK